VLNQSLTEKGEASSKDERSEKASEKSQEEGEDEEVDHNDNKRKGAEESITLETVKAAPKRNKPSLKSEDD